MVTFPPGTAGLSVEAGPTAAGAAPALSLRVTGRDAAQRAAPQNRRQLKPRSAYAPGNAQPAAGGGGGGGCLWRSGFICLSAGGKRVWSWRSVTEASRLEIYALINRRKDVLHTA